VQRGKYKDGADRCIKQWEKREERGKASDNVMKDRKQPKVLDVLIHFVSPLRHSVLI
jgi:hypothetical protein